MENLIEEYWEGLIKTENAPEGYEDTPEGDALFRRLDLLWLELGERGQDEISLRYRQHMTVGNNH